MKIDAIDPDWWLRDYRLPTREQMENPNFAAAVAARPELAAHLGRWLSRIGKSVSPDQKIVETITEDELRAAWEQTRS